MKAGDRIGKPNPERYQRLAVPVETPVAEERIAAFMEAVDALREEHGIPEAIVVAAVYTTDDESPSGRDVACVSCRWGSASTAGSLGRVAYDTFTLPEIERLRRLEVK